ncbi:TIGR03084 family metal-binding protein [Actinokineospora auranticolor]|uniref:Uncharacterized protein (TIGR03084 family) n=1 Tax=Actinokineospora auranticolor TaxID=155976 RepID=A0A2S6GHM8_9PSEU|nr:TIGR03084 family metal-binding protein [Actinokineospora auranticolor]PPK64719.1 uncharacterized protein (TIGR03084 family) [Actinokineospora auranticolor]
MIDLHALLADLRDEGAELDAWLTDLPARAWHTPTPAARWTIAHQVAHLAWTDDRALLSAADPDAFVADPDAFVAEATRALGDPTGFVDRGAEEGATRDPAELLAAWRTGRDRLADTLAHVPPGTKLLWYGPPMSPASMATARLMETWAHAGDVAAALDIPREPTRRLRHIAHLGVRTRDFAYLARALPIPAAEFRVELAAPDGETWTWGPQGAPQRITGSAHDFCLLVTQRVHRDDTDLESEGADAHHWLRIAQAFAGPPGTGRPRS